MSEFGLYPYVYSTGRLAGLRAMLEDIWPNNSPIRGKGTLYLISGFANYNGGARFYKFFKEHTEKGGDVKAILGGSSAQNTSSRQVAEALIDCGVKGWVTNRKALMHAKLYGYSSKTGDSLIVSSGNFTGPGMSRNVEASLLLREAETKGIGFSWYDMFTRMLTQSWPTHYVSRLTQRHPAWPLLYDEKHIKGVELESELGTMIITLSHADTVRIQAAPGSSASKGSQYFWLSKDCFDFFPPLSIRNIRGYKGTLSCLINLDYKDLSKAREERVTFEAENNLDFRFGTGLLRGTRLAKEGDLACITRIADDRYELRIIRKGTKVFGALAAYTSVYIGGRGKRYGIISNEDFSKMSGISLGAMRTATA